MNVEAAGRPQLEQRQARQARAVVADHRRAWRLGLFATGRLLLAVPFLSAGFDKAIDPGRAALLLSETVIDVHRVAPLVTAIELLLGVMLVSGWWTRRAAAAAIVYVGVAVLLMRPDLSVALGRAIAVANFALAGGLLMVVAHGPGRLSVDHVIARRWKRRAAAHVR